MSGKNSQSESHLSRADKFNSHSMGHIYGFLTDRTLVELQPVSRAWRQSAIETMEKRANEIKLEGVNTAEKKNVLFIYQCLQNLKNANGRPRTIVEFLPPRFRGAEHGYPPVPPSLDPWLKFRPKTYLHELNYLEIHELVGQNLFNRTLLELCQDDVEKASLVRETLFLRRFLPENQFRIPPSPSIFHRICGAIVTGIGGFILSILRNSLLAAWNLIYAALLLVSTPFTQLAACIGCINPRDLDFRYRRPRRIIEEGLFFILRTLYTIIHPFYCLFVGGYYGGKRGVYAPDTLINILKESEYDIERYVYNYPLLNILSTFPGREIPLEWRDNIAERALRAKRITQRDKLPPLVTTPAFSAPQRSVPERLVEPTAYTPLKGGEEKLLSADYGSRSLDL